MSNRNAVVLLSGGIDSAVVLSLAKRELNEVKALSVFYGQTNPDELAFAKYQAGKAQHEVYTVPSLTAHGDPNYYPSRNAILLSLATAYAESNDYNYVLVGFNKDDYDDYPDCRPEFVEAFNRVAAFSGVKVIAPLIDKTKAEVIRLGLTLGVNLDMTLSCYRPTSSKPCGECNACKLRDSAFKEVYWC